MMPYLHETKTGADARETAARLPPFGPGIERADIHRLEVWASDFKEPGDDYCEFRAFDEGGRLLATRRVGGY
jgi:hypothetical protein